MSEAVVLTDIVAIVNDTVQVVTTAQQGPAGPVNPNIDGGNAASVYLTIQTIDGGSA